MWQVWAVYPGRLTSRANVAAELTDGWVCFQSGGQRRRVVPVPAGWDVLNDFDLGLLCLAVTLVEPVRMPVKE